MTSTAQPLGHAAPARGVGRRAFSALWAHRWFALALSAVIGVGVSEGPRILFGPSVVADRVTRGAIVETVVATGNVLTPYRANIGSQITGTVTEVLVEEGQEVVKGQPLIALDDTELKAATVQAEGALAEAEARMRQLKDFTLPTAQENLAQAQANLVDAQKTFDRANALLKTGSGTQATLDDARKALDVARALVNAAQLSVYTSSPGGSDYVMARDAAPAGGRQSRHRQGPARLRNDRRAPRRRSDHPQRRARLCRPARDRAPRPGAGRPDATRTPDRRAQSRQARPRTEGARLGRRLSRQALRRGRQLHQPGVDINRASVGGEARRSRPACLSAPGHDRLCRHRRRPARRMRSCCQRTTCTTNCRARPGCSAFATDALTSSR